MMAHVPSRNVSGPNIYIYKAVVLFFSRVVLKKFDRGSLEVFRRLENICKKSSKLIADLKFLNFCVDNQLLPSFTNFTLYDVSAMHDPSTVEFKRKLVLREIEQNNAKLTESSRETARLLINLRQCTSSNEMSNFLNLYK